MWRPGKGLPLNVDKLKMRFPTTPFDAIRPKKPGGQVDGADVTQMEK